MPFFSVVLKCDIGLVETTTRRTVLFKQDVIAGPAFYVVFLLLRNFLQ